MSVQRTKAQSFLDRFRRDAVGKRLRRLQEKLGTLVPGANPTGDVCVTCGHEDQSRGASWESPELEVFIHAPVATHRGRCRSCTYCERITGKIVEFWERTW